MYIKLMRLSEKFSYISRLKAPPAIVEIPNHNATYRFPVWTCN